eukprot:TRINITY_DN55304_c0_g1_i1.p1 TRINITY_DN55304_c0_g1~~TRINITY_DN55304_c0_g1_i1.p1  ORF type:complete len:526 (+),score=102.88 TRINITY_DN55304_c0_g1_i1:107-1684(+)
MTSSKAILSVFVIAVHASTFWLAGAGALSAGLHVQAEPFVNGKRLRSLLPDGFDQVGLKTYSQVTTKRLDELRTALTPLFAAQPKDKRGGLAQVSIRYSLHRFLTQRRGLDVQGLEPGDVSWRASPSWDLVPKDQVVAFLYSLVEQALGGRKFGLEELCVLALVLEKLVDSEASNRFDLAVARTSSRSLLNQAEADVLISSQMESFVLGASTDADADIGEFSEAAPKDAMHVGRLFPAWNEAQRIATTAVSQAFAAKGEHSLSVPEVTRAAHVARERLSAAFHGVGCRQLQSSLLRMEDAGSGRVALSNFYKLTPSFEWPWHFQEERDYLRELGTLDETSRNTARVIIPNYITAKPNCIANSGVTSLCCPSECDTLFQSLEQEIAAHAAAPAVIVDIVEALNSSTVAAPRKLSPTMTQRLERVATRHGGAVPLHGRLFAQWMHHAFPRECPYPRAPDKSSDGGSMRDELRGSRLGGSTASRTSIPMEVFRCAVLLVALAATSVGLFRTARVALVNPGLLDGDKVE